MRHRGAFALMFAVALLLFSSNVLRAQNPPVTDDEVKVRTYNRFVENRDPRSQHRELEDLDALLLPA